MGKREKEREKEAGGGRQREQVENGDQLALAGRGGLGDLVS